MTSAVHSYHSVLQREEGDSGKNDPVLMELDSGHVLTEIAFLMPPPPPRPLPPQPTVSDAQQPLLQIITINTILLDKMINVVQPDIVIWYQSQFLHRMRRDPKETFLTLSQGGDNEPLDLNSRDEELLPRISEQMPGLPMIPAQLTHPLRKTSWHLLPTVMMN